MWRRQKCNYTYCVQDENEQAVPEQPTNGGESASYDYVQDPWLNYDFYTPYYMQRYCANPADALYVNPYYLNYMYGEDYDLRAAGLYDYDYWGEVTSPLYECGYQYVDPGSSSYNVPYYSPSVSVFGNYGDYEPAADPLSYGSRNNSYIGPVITGFGTITVNLQHNMRVEITVDKAIRITNTTNNSVAAMNASGESCAIIHPNGRIWQEGSSVHMETGQNMAKITKRGVIFTGLENSLVYLVDASGTKSTAEKFRNLQYDFSHDLFFGCSFHGREAVTECLTTLEKHFHRTYRRGDQVWTIAGVRIKQSLWGDVRVTRDFGRRILRSSPQFGSVSVSTPLIHMSVGSTKERQFFVRRADKKLTLDANGFNVKNGTQKAGLDSKGRLILS